MEQAMSWRRIVNEYGRMPDNTVYNNMLYILLMDFAGVRIGIERDGYAHT